ncbi:Replication factor C subunit 1 [Diplonema papillatum]|nr:Replication factor C subunit 1 [Diplonema papillatum]KAJ9449254.1 Replication factor C subunit 1 [Diplonema papillatum]
MPPKKEAKLAPGQTMLSGFFKKPDEKPKKPAAAAAAAVPPADPTPQPAATPEPPAARKPAKKPSPPAAAKNRETLEISPEARPASARAAEKEDRKTPPKPQDPPPPAAKPAKHPPARTPEKRKKPVETAPPASPKPAASAAAAAEAPAEKDAEEEEKAAKKRRFLAFKQKGYDNSALDPGSKPVPNGEETVLEGLTFIVTGRLESMNRGEAESLIKKHGGASRSDVTKRLNYLVVGVDPGESKIAKAKKFETKTLTEDELIKLIADKSAEKKVDPWGHLDGVDRAKWGAAGIEPAARQPAAGSAANPAGQHGAAPAAAPASSSSPADVVRRHSDARASPPLPAPREVEAGQGAAAAAGPSVSEPLWADKYAPKSTTQLVGHHAKAAEIRLWLSNWDGNAAAYVKNPKIDWKSGILIAGPPGIGKTTTASLVARECGYDVVEMNASDQRTKKSLREKVSSSIGTLSVASMFNASLQPRRKVIIMDEIGGLDAGGTTELIAILKQAKTPIICICNDKYAQKLRALIGHLKDLSFQRPPKNLIANYLKKLLREHEGVEVHEQALMELLEAAGNDIRSTLNNLQMWCKTANRLGYDALKRNQKTALKDADMSPFQSAQKLFNTPLSWPETQSLYFNNNLLGLFVQENYIYSGGNQGAQRMPTMAKVSRAIATADMMEASIRREGKWSLGPSAAFHASYYPIKMLGRHQLISYLPFAAKQPLPCFPGFMGKLSTTNKNIRLSYALSHEVSSRGMQGSSRDVIMDYVPALRWKVDGLMAKNDPAGAATLLSQYNVSKIDWDFAQDIETFKKMQQKKVHAVIDSKVKRAMTLQLNKLTDSTEAKRRRKAVGAPVLSAGLDDDDDEERSEEDEEEDLDAALLAAKGKKASAKKAAAKPASRKRAATEKKAPPKKKPRQNTK